MSAATMLPAQGGVHRPDPDGAAATRQTFGHATADGAEAVAAHLRH